MKKNEFRDDLFFRLNTLTVDLPVLKDRKSDLPLLLNFFNEKYVSLNGQIKSFDEDVLNIFAKYDWPGNVRELRNLIERIAILSPGNDEEKILNIIKESLSKSTNESFSVADNLSIPLREARENFEKEYLITQIKKFGGNISKTAKFVGMERSALHRKLKLLGVKDLN